MNELYKALCRLLGTKKFVFRFDEYTGAEGEPGEIYVENVVEYEFINSGTTIIELNAGLKLYPLFAGIEPTRVKLSVNYNERDETIYKYAFREFTAQDYRIVIDTNSTIGYTSPIDNPLPIFADAIVSTIDPKEKAFGINRLIVISKERYIPETMHDENPVVRKKKK